MNDELAQLALDIQAAVRTMNQCQLDYEKAKLDLGSRRRRLTLIMLVRHMSGTAYRQRALTMNLPLQRSASRSAAEEKLAAF